jgi:hypothetical protein
MFHPALDAALPTYLKHQLEDTEKALEAAVRAKGLEAILAYELWEFKQSVREALAQRDAQLAKRVIAGRHAFMERVAALPARQPSQQARDALLIAGY